jgi:hypothetical protein
MQTFRILYESGRCSAKVALRSAPCCEGDMVYAINDQNDGLIVLGTQEMTIVLFTSSHLRFEI